MLKDHLIKIEPQLKESPYLKNGLQALESKHQKKVHVVQSKDIKLTISFDMEKFYKSKDNFEKHESSWDYLISFAYQKEERIIFMEVHGANSQHEIDRMIKKIKWLNKKIQELKIFQFPYTKKWISTDSTIQVILNSPKGKQLAELGISKVERVLTI